MSRPSRIIVLAEDDRHQRFVRQYLYRKGFRRHEIHFGPLSAGRGSAEQWVRMQYGKHVQTCRERAATASTELIVVVDADSGTVENRSRQLAKALSNGGQETRNETEPIVHLIPRRNIETWILCLAGQVVDENADYKQRTGVDEMIKPAALEFFTWSRQNAHVPERCIESIHLAIHEIKRLE
ncbi:MAG: hypothetical protein C0504_14210 [Candidatus Solibacter sp.]|nr:hypothetical protein [Candidatus Solibacter sp.]